MLLNKYLLYTPTSIPINVLLRLLFVCAPLFPDAQRRGEDSSRPELRSNPELVFLGAMLERHSNPLNTLGVNIQPNPIENDDRCFYVLVPHYAEESDMLPTMFKTGTDMQSSVYYAKSLKSVETMATVSSDIYRPTGESKFKNLFKQAAELKTVKGPNRSNIAQNSYISERLTNKLNVCIEEFPLAFPCGSFEELKSCVLSVVNEHRRREGINRNLELIEGYITEEPLPLEMSNNTCYLVSLLHLIKTNQPLMNFIWENCVSAEYRNILIVLLTKTAGGITDEEFKLISPFTEEHDRTKARFLWGVQCDPIEFLSEILKNKCDLSSLQFFFFDEFNLIVNHKEEFNPIWGSPLVAHFSPYLCGSRSLPILNISLGHQNTTGPFNIQNILYGIQYSNLATPYDVFYSLPLFLNAPPFLILNLQYEINTNQSDSAESSQTGDFLKHNPLIFQDLITIRSLEDGETAYCLTGFIMNEAKHVNSTHYIPFYKYNDEWYSYYNDRRSQRGAHNFDFPLVMEYNDTHRITALFYAKLA